MGLHGLVKGMQMVTTKKQVRTLVAEELAILPAQLRQKRDQVPTLCSFRTESGLTRVNFADHAECELADGTHLPSGLGESLIICSQPPTEVHQIMSPPDRNIDTIVLDKIVFDQGPEHSSDEILCHS